VRRSASAPSLPRAVSFSRLLGGFVTLEIFGTKAGALCNSREHAGADFFAIVEGEDNIWPTLSGQRAVGSGLSLELPANFE
jgi:hypothetical protein